MRLMLLEPGTGHFYCGSCLRDNTLAAALRRLGHEVVVVPLYLPLVLEDADQPEQRVHMGGINMYLQQKTRLARILPRFLADLLDSPRLLRWASRRGKLTDAPDLGSMTVSMLRGEHGRQRKELGKLVDWAAAAERPDVVVLSNAMLCGVARQLCAALDCPAVVTLQGEAPFLDALPAPHSERAWQALRECAGEIAAFVPVSAWYGNLMRDRLGVAEDRVHVVHNGIDTADFAAEPEPLAARRPRTIGYLARICRDKGVDTLVDAFSIIAERGRVDDLRLRIAGVVLDEDRPLVDELRQRLRGRGLEDRVEFLPNVDRAAKLAFLRGLSVLSVPATYGESFGLYLLEAWASGVPVAQPRHGAFPEVLDATGGGVMCEPDDPRALAEALEELLLDEPRAQQLADRGRRAVAEKFTAERMAREFAQVCRMIACPTTDRPPISGSSTP